MSKRTSSVVHTGQLEGAKISIVAVHNSGLQESITIINRGTIVQPLSGWVLASLRGKVFFQFPDDFLARPGKCVIIHSGQPVPQKTFSGETDQAELLWTTDQIWNNHSDTAILFDANGMEIDLYSYPHERVTGSSDDNRKALRQNGQGFEIVDELLLREKKVTRKHSHALVY